MISLRFDKNKKEKKINFKVIATGVVAITLIGIVGISIGRYFKDIINYKSNSKKLESLQDENEKLKEEVIALNNKLDDVQSLDSLKKALNYIDEKYQAKSISTSVVGKND